MFVFSLSGLIGLGHLDQSDVRPYGGDSPEEAVKVTRSIMIIKPPGYQGGSAPVSPAGSTTPVSPNPFSGEFSTIITSFFLFFFLSQNYYHFISIKQLVGDTVVSTVPLLN